MIERSFGIIPFTKESGEYRFLLVQRNEGFWEFPKGHMEEGENEAEAAEREFSEETGFDGIEMIEDPVFKMRYTYKREGKIVFKTVKYFLGRVKEQFKEPEVQKEEIKYYRWANFEDATDLLTYKNAKQVLVKAQKHLKD